MPVEQFLFAKEAVGVTGREALRTQYSSCLWMEEVTGTGRSRAEYMVGMERPGGIVYICGRRNGRAEKQAWGIYGESRRRPGESLLFC
jgi:hypothetical protein